MRGRFPEFQLVLPRPVDRQLALRELQTVLEISIFEVVQIVSVQRILAVLKCSSNSPFAGQSEISLESGGACIQFTERVGVAGPAFAEYLFESFRELFKRIGALWRHHLERGQVAM